MFLKIESNVYLVGAERVCTYGHPRKRFIIRLSMLNPFLFSFTLETTDKSKHVVLGHL